jgi:type VI secretion system secreted protein VgrG
MRILQRDRHLVLESPLGEDELVLTGVSGSEHVNGLFEFHLEVISPRLAIDPAELLGKQVTFSIKSKDKKRHFTGIVSRFMQGIGTARDYRSYRLEVVPELWLLTQRADCRIFQNKTVPDIIKEVLSDAGVAAYEAIGLKSHPEHEYCVQYNETDFAFISRLMEEEGIVYFFKHSHGDHKMVLTDDTSAYYEIEEHEIDVRYISAEPMGLVDAVHAWERHERFIPNKWAHTDYNFKSPQNDLKADVKSVVELQRSGKFEIFDWRGDYGDKGRGRDLAKLRMEAQEASYTVVEGSGLCRFFTAGGKFTVKRHDAAHEREKTWVVASVHHLATDQTHLPNEREPTSYSNSFVCVPENTVLRSPRKTARPYIRGPQTAFVTGPSGEEIYTDEYGRIRVQFHWDRKGQKDEKSSCWIRVVQSWAGKKWGMSFTPRIGMEVVVEFLDGNPDWPIVTGCVFNGDFTPHWSNQGSETQSGLKTRSSKGGGDDNANALRFEDKSGSEEVWFHAQKDMKREVENDDTLTVDGKQDEKIKGDRTVEITQGNDSLNVKMGKCEITALQSITLKVGQSKITIDQTGITLEGMMIKSTAQMLSQTKGTMTQVTGDAMLTLKGGITMIG